MEPCKGFKDWLECLSCPHLCTASCPIEGENVMEKMKTQIHICSRNETTGYNNVTGK